jgi:hypothetical protein
MVSAGARERARRCGGREDTEEGGREGGIEAGREGERGL